VASALDAAHAARLVHRDVKPGNILVDVVPGRGEHAYLSDFGLSKRAMAVSGLTATGTFLGTPDYCAPEQIRGLPVDGRADQYSLACMAFALLAGSVPFHRQESMATLFAHLNDPVPSLARYRGDLPPGTDAVFARGLAKEPQDRYGRCGEFAAALRNAVVNAGHSASRQAFSSAGPSPIGQPPRGTPRPAPAAAPPPTWVAQPTAGVDTPTPAFPAARATVRRDDAAPGRPLSRPAPPPPAAGQGGKLPLVSRSAIIATLAAVAAFVLLLLLHGLG
jgi:serine/threonine protein kinase